jgi:hypothetical protein
MVWTKSVYAIAGPAATLLWFFVKQGHFLLARAILWFLALWTVGAGYIFLYGTEGVGLSIWVSLSLGSVGAIIVLAVGLHVVGIAESKSPQTKRAVADAAGRLLVLLRSICSSHHEFVARRKELEALLATVRRLGTKLRGEWDRVQDRRIGFVPDPEIAGDPWPDGDREVFTAARRTLALAYMVSGNAAP